MGTVHSVGVRENLSTPRHLILWLTTGAERETCAIKQLVISVAAGLTVQFLHCAEGKQARQGQTRPGRARPACRLPARGAGPAGPAGSAGFAGSWPLSGHNCRKRPWRALEAAVSASAWLSLTAESKPEAWSRAGLHMRETGMSPAELRTCPTFGPHAPKSPIYLNSTIVWVSFPLRRKGHLGWVPT